MSLSPELRILCSQLGSTPPADLPRSLPTLLQYVLRCQVPLSTPASNAAKADAPASSVLVHKLKTQLSALIYGKSSEGRFAAAVLIKGVVEVGGWEILRASESWVRGLLSLLGKPDPVVSKEICIIALTKIYSMTQQYPTLIREITTPTLPTFVTSCLNLITNSLTKVSDAPLSLVETVFQSFSKLLPRHTTIYRPFTSQIRAVTRPFLAPTVSDRIFVPFSLKSSARQLTVVLHLTVAKNAGGEEWAKSVRAIIKDVHMTADGIFRAVVEDWESTAGYIGEPTNVNQELCGGGKTTDDFPQWSGVSAGVERLVGLLELLAEYFQNETSTPVSIPLGAITDIVSRILSIAVPLPLSSTQRGARLHPAIDRDERDGLWCGMPQIYVAVLELINTVAERLEEGFMPLAPGILDQILWAFPYGRGTPEFRLVSYTVIARVLQLVGRGFDRSQTQKISPIIRSCCKDLDSSDSDLACNGATENAGKKPTGNGIIVNQNADTFIQSKETAASIPIHNTPLDLAAKELLPLLISCLPQQYLDISLRAMIERTAILNHDKNAMLSSILNPFVGKNGRSMASILPHLTREFPHDDVVEILLRPRMPLLPTSSTKPPAHDAFNATSEDDMDANLNVEIIPDNPTQHNTMAENYRLSGSLPVPQNTATQHNTFGTTSSLVAPSTTMLKTTAMRKEDQVSPLGSTEGYIGEDVNMDSGDESSDDESIHLTMQIDTDSELEVDSDSS